ncbi:MAG TPA: hypothetical protein VM123_02330 [archaeon]|nr:hypothetical protein [archaeon]
MRTPTISFWILPLVCVFLLYVSGCGTQATIQEKEPSQAAAAKVWQVIGPGGGGSLYEPTINPSDPNNVFVRCDMTGAYVTQNGGRKWRMFNLRTVVLDFEFDPGNPNTVYASNTGLHRSEDRGRRWRLIYPDPKNIKAELMLGDHASQVFETTDGMPDGSIVKVRVDPANSDHLYLGLTPGWSRGDASRLLYSTDRGANWKVLAEIPGRTVLAIFPGSWDGKPDELTVITERACVRVSKVTGEVTGLPLPVEGSVRAADGGRKASGGSLIYILTGMNQAGDKPVGGVYRTSDRGDSWVQVNQGLLGDWPEAPQLPRFSTLAVCEGRPEVVYLSCGMQIVMMNGYPQWQRGILRTETGGESWGWVLRLCGGSVMTDNFKGGWLQRCLGWLGNPSNLGVCPTNPDICYATDSGRTYRSLDGGKTWEQVISEDFPDGSMTTRGLDVTTTYGVHFDPYDKSHFFISYTDIGLFHTFDGGRTWFHAITGIPRQWRNTCYWLAFDPAVKGRIWAAWSNVHDLPRPKMFRSGNLVNGRQQGGVSVSSDGGRWWELCNVGVSENGEYSHGMRAGAVCTHILIDPRSPVDSRTLYVCDFGMGVYKSADGGETWEVKNNGLGPNRNAWRMVLLPTGRLILLVARGGIEGREMIDGALYVSDDGAESWQALALPEGYNAPNDLVFEPSAPWRMYLSCWPWSKEGAEHCGGLLHTEDGGKTWKQVFREQAHVYAAAVDSRNPGTVFINTFNSAAFRSDDRGENWRRLEGYNFKWGHRPVPDPNNPGMLYLTTFGGSVYYGPADGVPGAFEDIEDSSFLLWHTP